MPDFHRPANLAEACQLMSTLDDPMVYGGGTAIQILTKQGVLFASDLVDISRVPGLDAISQTESSLRVGAMVTVRRMETDPLVRRFAPLVSCAYGHVANPRVRNTASVGGNIAHGDYRLDPPGALLVLDARVELASVRGTRSVPVREFFVDFQRTAVEHGEIVTAVEIPRQPTPAAAFVKLPSLSANDWPCASATALVASRSASERVLRLGLGAVAPVPTFLEVVLDPATPLDAAVDAAREAVGPVLDPIPDIRGGVAFKRRLAMVAVGDAVAHAWPDQQAAQQREEEADGGRFTFRRRRRGR